MSDEIKKKVTLVGGDGVTKSGATITEEDRNPRSLEAIHAKDLIQKAAELYKPLGCDYLGSAVVHYYKQAHATLNKPTFLTAQQVALGEEVTEQHADFGWKQLKTALMKAFGRKEPRSTL